MCAAIYGFINLFIHPNKCLLILSRSRELGNGFQSDKWVHWTWRTRLRNMRQMGFTIKEHHKQLTCNQALGIIGALPRGLGMAHMFELHLLVC